MLKLGVGKTLKISKWVKKDATVTYISSKAPVSCRMDQKLGEVISILSKQHRRLPVLNKEGHVRGVISSTDVLRMLSGKGKKKHRAKKHEDVKVKSVMSSHVMHIDKNMKLSDVMDFFKKHRKGAYPVTYRKGLVGVVSEWDIVRQIRGKTGVKVSDVMVRRPMVAQDHHSVADVAGMLSVGGFRRLPVVKNGILVGIVTSRDLLTFLNGKGLLGKIDQQKQPVTEIMKKDVMTVRPDADIHAAAQTMVSKEVGGLPVVEDHQLIGIITERDIVDVVEF